MTTVRGKATPNHRVVQPRGTAQIRWRVAEIRTVTSRAAAIFAALCTLAGAVAVATAVVATRRLWFGGYVSEAGVSAQPHASTYRLGMLGLAAGLVLLGVAVARISRAAAVLLAAGGVLGTVSGSVSCTAGCPLPPFDRTSVADLVHGGASALAVAACTLAMLAVGRAATDRGTRSLSLAAFALVAPLVALEGLGMLTVGRGYVTGLIERATLVASSAWIIAVALRQARPQAWPQARP